MNVRPAPHHRRRFRAVLAVAALLALPASGALGQAALGDPAPDFTLTGNDGQSYTLSDAFGEKVQLLHMVGYG